MSAPLSSQAISVPSVALSPTAEEERPLLLSKKPLSRDEQKRTSAHYNHGHAAHSLPPSPVSTINNVNYQISISTAANEERVNTNNIINNYNTKTAGVSNGHVPYNTESSGDDMLESKPEDPQGDNTAIGTADSTTGRLFRATDSSRTNPTSPNNHLQVTSSNAATKPNPGAV